MKKFVGKNKEEALALAATELNVPVENIYVDEVVEHKGLFGRIKSVEVTCYTDAMVVEFVQDYLKRIIEKMGIEVKTTPSYTDGLIRIKLTTNHNSILIGKDGETLQALNEVCRNAANATFKKRVRILLDINDYKQEKYSKLMSDLEYEEYIENALDEADKEAEDPNTKYYSHEEFKQMARRIIDGEK